ncbi:MAG: peptidyl-tRNA hydrolase [Thermoanaerobaculum sp.]|nr:MAG: peptidyl-tRNA hydrolase [Thermoanaerobaculum sp.]
MELAAIVGLGNPGAEYERTRHNVGFRVVDELARRFRCGSFKLRPYALVAERTGSRRVLFVKPTTYMNRSGQAVAALCGEEGLVPAQVLVVVDDVDLPLGQLRLRSRGGPGTHNGLRSVVEAVGEGFPRLRLGVRGAQPWSDLAAYVLAPFTEEEEPVAEAMVQRAADCVEEALFSGLARAANRFNVRNALE